VLRGTFAIAVSRVASDMDWAASEWKAAAFLEVVRVASSRGIPVLPVKGVLTARLLYEDPAQRPMVDVDVRVRARELEALCVAGLAAGWKPLERSHAYRSATFELNDGERVELEAHIGPPGFCRITASDMIARAREHVAPFGAPHLQPDLHDHALLLVVNVFKDQIVEASPHALTDLERIARLPGFSFAILAARAAQGGVAGLAWVVAQWMEAERHAPEWSALRAALGDRAPRPRFAATFRALARKGGHGGAAGKASLPLRLLARFASDTLAMRAHALARTAAWMLEMRAAEYTHEVRTGA
jgi:hypothetical protein